MNTKYTEGYWVNQLSDEEIKELFEILISKKKNLKFNGVHKITRGKESLSVLFVAKKTNVYSSNPEHTSLVSDFKITGGLAYLDFYEFMIEKFGEEYSDELLNYIDSVIDANPEDTWSKRLKNVKKAIPAIIDSHTHSQHNDL